MIAEFRSDIGSIADICGGDLLAGLPESKIDTITSDSRELGRKNLFIPLTGEKFDGHNFIGPLAEKGSIDCYLTMKENGRVIAEHPNLGCIRCKNTLTALGRLGAFRRKEINPRVVGITGTNGKTTVKELIYTISARSFGTLKNEKNYNNEIGVPFSLLNLKSSHSVAVIEMGMNHPGEIGRLADMTRPDAAVITNVGEGHLEFLGTTEGVARSKVEIIQGMKKGSRLFLNADSLHLDLLKRSAEERGLFVKTFGIQGKADFVPDSYSLSEQGVELRFMGEKLSVPVYGIHNLYNVMAALTVSLWLGIDVESAGKALAGFENVEGRSQIINLRFTLINDTYNSNPLSSRSALESISRIYPKRRKIAVLSDMKELGGESPAMHRETGRFAAEMGFDLLLVWGEMSGFYREGAAYAGMKGNNTIVFESKEELSDYLNSVLRDEDVVLVKGSRSMKMEDVVNSIMKRAQRKG